MKKISLERFSDLPEDPNDYLSQIERKNPIVAKRINRYLLGLGNTRARGRALIAATGVYYLLEVNNATPRVLNDRIDDEPIEDTLDRVKRENPDVVNLIATLVNAIPDASYEVWDVGFLVYRLFERAK